MHKCPECGKEFASPRSLGPHRNKAHGYRTGPGKPVIKKVRGPYKKRSTTVPAQEGIVVHAQAEVGPTARQSSPRAKVPESTLAFTAGKIEELLYRQAVEFDVPPRSFAAGVLELVLAKTLR